MYVLEAELDPSTKGVQSALLELMDRLERAGADEVDADEDPAHPHAYGYFHHAAPGPEAVAAAEAAPGVRAVRSFALPRLRTVAVPDGVRRPFVWGPFELRTSATTSAPAAPHPIVLDTYTAWGTGLHPTTALMLDRLASLGAEGAVLDVGTGTGVLALGALALGARSATVTDIEPVAMEAATKNAAANKMQDRLTARGDTPPASLEGEFEVVLANIRAEPLCALAAGLVARCAPSATLLVSGVRAHEFARVCEAFEAHGARLEDQTHAQGWLCLRFAAP